MEDDRWDPVKYVLQLQQVKTDSLLLQASKFVPVIQDNIMMHGKVSDNTNRLCLLYYCVYGVNIEVWLS